MVGMGFKKRTANDSFSGGSSAGFRCNYAVEQASAPGFHGSARFTRKNLGPLVIGTSRMNPEDSNCCSWPSRTTRAPCAAYICVYFKIFDHIFMLNNIITIRSTMVKQYAYLIFDHIYHAGVKQYVFYHLP